MCEHTMRALLKEGAALLEKNGIGEAGLDAWLLMEYVTGKKQNLLFCPHGGSGAQGAGTAVPRTSWDRRREHIPLQHLTHQAFFMDMRFL